MKLYKTTTTIMFKQLRKSEFQNPMKDFGDDECLSIGKL